MLRAPHLKINVMCRKLKMQEPTILAGFSNVDLVDFQYHIGEDLNDRYILMKCKSRDGKVRDLRFNQPSNLKIDEGFWDGLSGMAIVDISSRQWANAKIEVVNFEQDPGITFIAMSMDVLVDEIST